jgi:hypothetical protein
MIYAKLDLRIRLNHKSKATDCGHLINCGERKREMNSSTYTAGSPGIVEFVNAAVKALGVQSLASPIDIFAFEKDNHRVTAELKQLAVVGIKAATTSFTVPNPATRISMTCS